jgi:hypothetical protein
MDDLGIFIDNIERVDFFWPKTGNGKQSLLLSDNNFSDKQKT